MPLAQAREPYGCSCIRDSFSPCTVIKERGVSQLCWHGGGTRRVTLGGDKNYDTKDFVAKLKEAAVTPHVAQHEHARRSSAIDARTTRHEGYVISQRKRKRVEEIFGWIKTVAGLRKTRHRGRKRVSWMFTLAAAAFNLVRMRNLGMAAA